MALKESVKLSSGHKMPLLGLGVWQMDPNSKAVETALESGYRAVDTAFIYMNEETVGNSIQSWIKKKCSHKREDLFITTKLPMNAMRADLVEKFLKLSLKKLQLSQVDLYLVHSPIGTQFTGNEHEFMAMNDKGLVKMDYGTDLIAIWKAMESMVDKGLTKSIGVSNFSVKQLRKILAIARIPPAVHQIELHLRFQRHELVDFCKENKIVVTSYASLGSPGRKDGPFGKPKFANLLEDPVVELVANNHKVTPAQVCLRYWVQRGVTVIPKSENPIRIAKNSKVFEWKLSDLEMAALRTLDMGEEGRCFTVDNNLGMLDHPEMNI